MASALAPEGLAELVEPPVPLPLVEVPEGLRYRLKCRLLGPPLVSSGLRHQRLSKKVALGVLSPDCISSSAYGSEEMLRILVPVIGAAAFSMLLPVTGAILLVLLIVTLAYRDVVMIYTRIGGSYAVTRDNFGPNVAQIAAAALLIDYVVTVAVQTAAGTDAVLSLLRLLVGTTAADPWAVEITIGVVVVLCYGNLRGIREAGRVFALPTYLFAGSVGVVIVVGLGRAIFGHLPRAALHAHGVIGVGHEGGGILLGASVFILLRAFANGGSSLTGLEAISDSVPAFQRPEGANARRTLVFMAAILGTLVLGVSLLAFLTHAVPYASGAPTVIAQEARLALGNTLVGKIGFAFVQVATALILYTGANTSFNGFPFLASYVAGDSYLPRWFTHRGHRLGFSNGIVVLFGAAVALLVATGASVDRLVAIYAIGVFTSFAMTGFGMTRYHRRNGGRRLPMLLNATAGGVSALIVLIFAVTKFTEGAWVVVLLGPALVFGLIHTNRRYQAEDRVMEAVPTSKRQPNFARHVVVVLVNSLDLTVVRALRYARSIAPGRVRAVHFVVDEWHAERLVDRWQQFEAADVPLEMVECPDRRIPRAATEFAAALAADDRTEVTVLLPRRTASPVARLFLHDRTSEAIADAVTKLPHVAATVLPFHPDLRVTARPAGLRPQPGRDGARPPEQPMQAQREQPPPAPPTVAGGGAHRPTPIKSVVWRQRARIRGQLQSVETPPSSVSPMLRCTLVDDTGGILLLFYGRRAIPGLRPGVTLEAEGMVGKTEGRLSIANPRYDLLVD